MAQQEVLRVNQAVYERTVDSLVRESELFLLMADSENIVPLQELEARPVAELISIRTTIIEAVAAISTVFEKAGITFEVGFSGEIKVDGVCAYEQIEIKRSDVPEMPPVPLKLLTKVSWNMDDVPDDIHESFTRADVSIELLGFDIFQYAVTVDLNGGEAEED